MARVTTNLKLYQLSLKQVRTAKKMNLWSARAKAIASEYEEYQKEYYRLSKQLREAGVKMSAGHKQGLWIPNYVAQYEARGKVMSIGQYIRYSKRYSDLSAAQIALKQYNLISLDVAETLQQALIDNGLGEYSLEVIRARQLPEEVWIKMQQIAEQNEKTISQFFYGSP